MSHLGAFWNQLRIGTPGAAQHFRTDDNDDGVGLVAHTIPPGYYYADTLRNALLTLIATDIAAIRIAISTTGHWTFDNNGGGNFRIVIDDPWLGVFLGFTSVTLTGQNSYTGSRRMRGSWYPDRPPSIYDPQPYAAGGASQEFAASGAAASEACGEEPDETQFEFPAVNNVTEYSSPAGSYGASYGGAGITDFSHARDFWWKLKDASGYQVHGWRNGRPVRWFPDRDDSDIAISGAGHTHSSSLFTTWIFDKLERWGDVAVPTRNRMSTLYDLNWHAREYVES